MVRAACLTAVAGLAVSGSMAFGDALVYDATQAGSGNPAALFRPVPPGTNGPLTTFVGNGLTIADPTPDPIAITGIDIQIANGTRTTFPAGTVIRINCFVWDFEDAASAGTTPAFQTLLSTQVGDLTLGAAWNHGTLIGIANANPTLPGFQFDGNGATAGTPPVTGFTDTEMAMSFNVQAGNGTTFNNVEGLSVVFRDVATVGTADTYVYLSQEGEADGNFFGENAFVVGAAPTCIAMAVFNASSGATPFEIAALGTDPALPLASCDGTGVTLLVQVQPGTLPDSTGITVTADTTALGGLANAALLDDGLNDDGAAGDNLFGLVQQLPPGPEVGLNVPVTISDAQARTDTGTIVVNRDTYPNLPAAVGGGGPGTATITGVRTGNDDDMFAICVSDANNFGASTVGGATWDSQLFLFDANGIGVVHNDDDPNDPEGDVFQSNITGFPLIAGGYYNLLITGFNRDPMDNVNALIWEDDDGAGNTNTVRAPDGPGAANPIALYLGAGNAGGAYTITLTGATAVCPADLSNTDGTDKPDCAVDINDLLFFLSNFEAGDVVVDLTDPSFGSPDCAVDVNDLLFFLARFEGGC